jgi:hypothetical protein
LSTFKPHFSALPAAQKQLWPQLTAAKELGFVLYGGTAVALRLGHRISVDFDFFNDSPLDKAELAKALPLVASATVLQDQSDVLTISVALKGAPVKLSFFGGIDFGHFVEPEITDDGVLEVAALDDLLGTKLKTILQRAESKDYRDIAAMTKSGANLSRGLAIARHMFGNTFQPAESLKALTYFKDGDLKQLTAAERKILISAAADVRDLPPVTRRSRTLSARTKTEPATPSATASADDR